MTMQEIQKLARYIGMTIKKTEYGEFRVNYRNGKEATASYATDLDDAWGTARAIATTINEDTAHELALEFMKGFSFTAMSLDEWLDENDSQLSDGERQCAQTILGMFQ